jgi:hypothetical protein
MEEIKKEEEKKEEVTEEATEEEAPPCLCINVSERMKTKTALR